MHGELPADKPPSIKSDTTGELPTDKLPSIELLPKDEENGELSCTTIEADTTLSDMAGKLSTKLSSSESPVSKEKHKVKLKEDQIDKLCVTQGKKPNVKQKTRLPHLARDGETTHLG